MSRVGIAVYDRAGALVADLDPELWTLEDYVDELDDTGSIRFNVQADDPDVDAIQPGQIVVVSLDASPIWRGVIKQRVWREVADDEAGRYATFSGVGEVGRLDEMVVYPTGGLGRFPPPTDRSFDWTAPEFDDSGWDTPVETDPDYGLSTEVFGLPTGYPFPTAEWIWDVDVSGGSIPAEVKEFRKSGVTVAATGVFEAHGAADDRFESWVDGVPVLKSSDAPYEGRPFGVEMLVTAGTICVAVRAENRNTLKAGLLYGIGKPKEVGDTPIVVSDDTWKIRPDGATLGMNAGEILNVLLDEFVARGGVAPARTWTDSLDSDGNAWSVTEELTVSIGTPYLDVLRQMVELEMCDFRMSPDGFELNLYNAGGAGSTVAYTLGDNSLTSLTWESAPAISTALLTQWARGWTDEDDATLITAHGRRESMLSLGGLTSEATAQGQAATVIARLGTDRTEIAASIDPEDQASEPYTKYQPGDSITVPGPSGSSVQKVLAVALGLDDAGNPTWEVHLNDRIEEVEKRQQILLRRMAGGSVAGRTQTTTIPYEPRALQPPEPQDEVWSTGSNVTAIVGDVRSFARVVRIVEFRMELKGTITGTYTARLLHNGSAITGSSISLTAAGEKYVPLSEIVLQRPGNNIEAEITAVGSGATGMTLTAVYA